MTLSDLLCRARGSAAAPLAVTAILVLGAAAMAQTASPPPLRIEPLEGEYVTTARTNVRQQPSAQATRVGRIEPGAKVRVTGKVAGASWYAVVQEDGKPGFVAAEQLRAAPAAPVTTAAPAAPATDAALREQLAKIEAALSDINRQMPSVKDLESLSASVKGLLEREEKRAAELLAAGEAKVAPAEGPTIAERMAKIQDQISQQIAEQRAEFGKLSERLDSVENSVQPLIDWAKGWTAKAAPAADSAQSWLYSTYASVRDWVVGWIPWLGQPAQSPGTPTQRT